MGCCLIAESKDDFKGYRIVKGKEKIIGSEKI